MNTSSHFHIGCASLTVPAPYAAHFPPDGTHLERYSRVFPAGEINSSFYRHHRRETYARWAASAPEDFRFAVKMPKIITHGERLRDTDDTTQTLERFLGEVAGLGSKLGPLLVQLPPSLALDEETTATFFSHLRETFSGYVVCEPRHVSWFTPEADTLLTQFEVARVAADPALVPQAGVPGAWPGLIYYRLHGSPRIYYSSYEAEVLVSLAAMLEAAVSQSIPTWCIFDNTAAGAAIENGLDLLRRLNQNRE